MTPYQHRVNVNQATMPPTKQLKLVGTQNRDSRVTLYQTPTQTNIAWHQNLSKTIPIKNTVGIEKSNMERNSMREVLLPNTLNGDEVRPVPATERTLQ